MYLLLTCCYSSCAAYARAICHQSARVSIVRVSSFARRHATSRAPAWPNDRTRLLWRDVRLQRLAARLLHRSLLALALVATRHALNVELDSVLQISIFFV